MEFPRSTAGAKEFRLSALGSTELAEVNGPLQPTFRTSRQDSGSRPVCGRANGAPDRHRAQEKLDNGFRPLMFRLIIEIASERH
jgi:hypothetical protein